VILRGTLDADLALLTLNRSEKRNALTTSSIVELTRALRDADGEASIRGIVLSGAGPSFCAGVDLHEFAEGTPGSARELITALAELCRTARELPKPIACAIQGYCLGGALELAVCCDVRVCGPDARFGMPEVGLGIPSVIDAVLLGRSVGEGRARELLLTGDPIDAPTALAWGLVNHIEDDPVRGAAALVRRITRHDAHAIAAQKRLHQQWLEVPYTQAVNASIESLIEAFERGAPQRTARQLLSERRR
jgi:enoyl-CoA hydratase